MKHLITAFQFLTVLPFGRPQVLDASKSTPFFPIVGLGIGLVLVLGNYLFSLLWPASVVSLLDVLVLALLSGGLHLDGLGDTADGLFSHRSKKRALEIMRDSRIGVMGLLAILFVLSLKWVGLQSISEHRALYLLIIPAYSRGAMVFGIRFLKYGRPEGGIATDFFADKPPTYFLTLILVPVCLSCWLGYSAIWFNGLFVFMALILLIYFNRKMGCITGDMLGALGEVLESWLFLAACLSPQVFS